jgi:hypothetical protein
MLSARDFFSTREILPPFRNASNEDVPNSRGLDHHLQGREDELFSVRISGGGGIRKVQSSTGTGHGFTSVGGAPHTWCVTELFFLG